MLFRLLSKSIKITDREYLDFMKQDIIYTQNQNETILLEVENVKKHNRSLIR